MARKRKEETSVVPKPTQQVACSLSEQELEHAFYRALKRLKDQENCVKTEMTKETPSREMSTLEKMIFPLLILFHPTYKHGFSADESLRIIIAIPARMFGYIFYVVGLVLTIFSIPYLLFSDKGSRDALVYAIAFFSGIIVLVVSAAFRSVERGIDKMSAEQLYPFGACFLTGLSVIISVSSLLIGNITT